jgi:hypothetical protein
MVYKRRSNLPDIKVILISLQEVVFIRDYLYFVEPNKPPYTITDEVKNEKDDFNYNSYGTDDSWQMLRIKLYK